MISKDETIINAKSSKIFKPLLSEINSYKGYGIKFAASGYGNASGSVDGRALVNNAQSRFIDDSRTEILLKRFV